MFKKILIGIGALLVAVLALVAGVSWWAVNSDTSAPPSAAAQPPAAISKQALVNRAEAHLVDHIKSQMHDPGSFEIAGENVTDRGSYVILNMHFRGKNPLGATVLSQGVIAVSVEGKVLSLELRQ